MCFSCAALFKLLAPEATRKQPGPVWHSLLTSRRQCMGNGKSKNVHFLQVEDYNELLDKHSCDGPVQHRASDEDMQQSQADVEGAANIMNLLAHFVQETPNHFVLSAAVAERQMQFAPLRQRIGRHKEDYQSEHDDTSTECDSDNELGEVDMRWASLVQGLRFSTAWQCGPVVDESQDALNSMHECLETLEKALYMKAFEPQDQAVADERQCARSLESMGEVLPGRYLQEDVDEDAISRSRWTERFELVRENLEVLPYDPEDGEGRHHVAESPEPRLIEEKMTRIGFLPYSEVFNIEHKLSESSSEKSWSTLSTVTSSSPQSEKHTSLLRKCLMCCSTADDRTGELRFQDDISGHDAP